MPDAKQLFLQTMPLLLHRCSGIFLCLLQNHLRWVLKELPNWHQMLHLHIFVRFRPCVGTITIFYCSYCLILYTFNSLDTKLFFMIMTIKTAICFLVFMDIDIKSFRGHYFNSYIYIETML